MAFWTNAAACAVHSKSAPKLMPLLCALPSTAASADVEFCAAGVAQLGTMLYTGCKRERAWLFSQYLFGCFGAKLDAWGVCQTLDSVCVQRRQIHGLALQVVRCAVHASPAA